MRRLAVACAAVVLLVSASLQADLTVTQTFTFEGAAMALMSGNAAPRVTLRVKGSKARTESEMMGQTNVVLSDLASRQTVMLNAAEKTARVLGAQKAPDPAAAPAPAVEATFTPTGQKRTIDGVVCDEYAIAMTLGMGDMAPPGSPAPPEAAAHMLEGVKLVLTGSMWVAKSGPGVQEFAAFQKAAAEANMVAVLAGGAGAGNGIDRIMAAAARTRGLPYLTEITMNVEGSGQVAEMMKQMGPMKIINKVTAISIEALPDDLFKVPDGYTMVK